MDQVSDPSVLWFAGLKLSLPIAVSNWGAGFQELLASSHIAPNKCFNKPQIEVQCSVLPVFRFTKDHVLTLLITQSSDQKKPNKLTVVCMKRHRINARGAERE